METKLFEMMSTEEKRQWITDYQQWLHHALPIFEKAAFLTEDIKQLFEQGLDFLAAHGNYQAFISESRSFGDYIRRIPSLLAYFANVNTDIAPFLSLLTPANQAPKVEETPDVEHGDVSQHPDDSGDQGSSDTSDTSAITPPEPHVGRPTLEEAAAKEALAQKALEEKANEDTLFGKRGDLPEVPAPAPMTISGSVPISSPLSLANLAWLMSPELQKAIETVRELRFQAGQHAERAKMLAEANAPAEEIKPLAEAAARYTEEYEAIYQRVDDEMATAYVRFKEDTRFIEEMEKRNIVPADMRTLLRPYWDKVENKEVFKQQVIEQIKANDPEQAKIRAEKEAKKKKLDAILKYLQRTDRENTPKRIETMKAKYQEIVALVGEEEAKVYYPIITAAEKDMNENVLPAKEVAKEKKAAEKAAKAEAKAAKKKNLDNSKK